MTDDVGKPRICDCGTMLVWSIDKQGYRWSFPEDNSAAMALLSSGCPAHPDGKHRTRGFRAVAVEIQAIELGLRCG